MTFLRVLWEIFRGGVLRGWPGRRCPQCKAGPGRRHYDGCSIGKWDGGTWA